MEPLQIITLLKEAESYNKATYSLFLSIGKNRPIIISLHTSNIYIHVSELNRSSIFDHSQNLQKLVM